MTFDWYIRKLRNCLAYFSQNPQIRNCRIYWWKFCSLLSPCFSFSLFLFCLPDTCACAVFRENQNKRKPSIPYQYTYFQPSTFSLLIISSCAPCQCAYAGSKKKKLQKKYYTTVIFLEIWILRISYFFKRTCCKVRFQ